MGAFLALLTTVLALPPIVLISTLASAVLISGCSDSGGAKEPSKRGAGGEAVPVLAATAVTEDFPIRVSAIGKVAPVRSVEVRARVTGELTAVHFAEGQTVRKGDPLFTIDRRPFEAALRAAEADLARGQARLRTAAADARRAQELIANDFVTRQQYEQAMAAAAAESASVQSLDAEVETARLNLEYCSIRAPISGRTGSLAIQEGNLVRANDADPLVVIHQLDPIHVVFSVPESRLPELQARWREAAPIPVEAKPPGTTAAGSLGRLVFVDNQVDRGSGTVLLKAEFPNEPDALWPGQFVDVNLVLSTLKQAVVVPETAVQTGQDGEFVYVVGADQKAVMQPVRVAARSAEQAVIAEGVLPGATVVTDGQLRLVPGARVAVRSSLEEAAGQRSGRSGAGAGDGDDARARETTTR